LLLYIYLHQMKDHYHYRRNGIYFETLIGFLYIKYISNLILNSTKLKKKKNKKNKKKKKKKIKK